LICVSLLLSGEVVDLKIAASLVKVLVSLYVEDRSAQILKVGGSLRHLKRFLNLHNFFKFREKTGSKNVLCCKLESIKNCDSKARVFFV